MICKSINQEIFIVANKNTKTRCSNIKLLSVHLIQQELIPNILSKILLNIKIYIYDVIAI